MLILVYYTLFLWLQLFPWLDYQQYHLSTGGLSSINHNTWYYFIVFLFLLHYLLLLLVVVDCWYYSLSISQNAKMMDIIIYFCVVLKSISLSCLDFVETPSSISISSQSSIYLCTNTGTNYFGHEPSDNPRPSNEPSDASKKAKMNIRVTFKLIYPTV